MRGGAIFLVFFMLFTVATLAVPIPLFPGNVMHSIFSSLGVSFSLYAPLLDAVANGLFYGFIVWLAFFLVSRRLEEPEVVVAKEKEKRKRRK